MQNTQKVIVAILFCTFLFSHCNEAWGDHPLGNGLSLLEGDKKEDRVIVLCSKENGICDGGLAVIPTDKRQFDSLGHYAEYVEDAVSNKDWVIAKTLEIKNKNTNYWLISKAFKVRFSSCGEVNCDSILRRYVTGPLTLAEFNERKKTLNIDLEFK